MDDAGQQLRLGPYLLPAETILWTGKPNPYRLLACSDLVVIPFTLFFAGFALLWLKGSTGTGAPDFFALVGIPFVLVGQYLVWGRFIYKSWDRRRTVYAVTNQRVLILRGASLQSVFLNQLPALNPSVRADGSGSLEFQDFPPGFRYRSRGGSGMDPFEQGPPVNAFYDIPDVANVCLLINQARGSSG